MRASWIVAGALAGIVAGNIFYAVVGSPFVKVPPKADPPPVATVHLFSAPNPKDLIATKLAIQPGLPNVQEKKSAPPKKQQAKSKAKPKPKKSVAVAGSP
jgi:hypothetical protein